MHGSIPARQRRASSNAYYERDGSVPKKNSMLHEKNSRSNTLMTSSMLASMKCYAKNSELIDWHPAGGGACTPEIQ